ncbi:hypothetical protein Tco_0680247 [Tanacetum coccineum]|uniref:Uncharacterized protein n=1 Tax=Tanacetum coccineum TaxID=301880 RepID=A0ABQ4XK06_9ASTR
MNVCELCRNDAHYDYDCSPQVPFVYNQNPCFDQNFDNNFPQTSPSFPQQYLCCENCRGSHTTFQCQPMNQSLSNSNSSSFDQFQPPQYPVIHHSTQETSEEVLQAREDLMKAIQTFLRKFSHNSFINGDRGILGNTITSVENIVPIPNSCEILSDSNDDDTSSDDNDFEDIEYISLEEVNNDQEEKEFYLEDILQIKDVILREKLLNISRLITNIESLNDNPIPDRVLNSPSLVLISITDSNSNHMEETRSGSTTTHANNSLPEYDSFLFEFESFYFDPSFPHPPPEPPDVEISLIIETDAPVINNFDELNEDECFDPGGGEIDVEDNNSFTFVIRTFLLFLTYPEDSPLLLSTGSEDTIFDPDIST